MGFLTGVLSPCAVVGSCPSMAEYSGARIRRKDDLLSRDIRQDDDAARGCAAWYMSRSVSAETCV
ncbi:hypothetical protein GCM10010910_05650 [Microbacterium nanhaiense]|uniref:Uncharacterized protein n=1 Tax=Microbacterium nanhaiense TaxID=1301026 RepID=A0ABQ2MYC0_9MICO|nr:hypothetical protein GCM10010910_05650 [Microbacterium nanhaiense]